MQLKSALKISLLPAALQKLADDLGLGLEDCDQLGPEWKSLCKAYISAEASLAEAGGGLLALEDRVAAVPHSLVQWSNT